MLFLDNFFISYLVTFRYVVFYFVVHTHKFTTTHITEPCYFAASALLYLLISFSIFRLGFMLPVVLVSGSGHLRQHLILELVR